MSILACKTRGDASPQGKPRVYFCCHPADFSQYFEPISEEVLRLQNCALYYPQNGAAVYDEGLLADLTQMQLFVMPVTEKLLTTENTALSVAFPLAVEHHIPVLPLMQEPGLDALFNQRCGERQYLDKHTADQTALRYEDKLKAYLEKVLVSDTAAEKVRGAFDTYIFLSYRKKDRRYAQELMRLIHQRPAYENMAIWYDEFLVPGENFNDNIQAALDKSRPHGYPQPGQRDQLRNDGGISSGGEKGKAHRRCRDAAHRQSRHGRQLCGLSPLHQRSR